MSTVATTPPSAYMRRLRERTDAAAHRVPDKVPEGCQVSPDTPVSVMTEELVSDLVRARAARTAQRHPIPHGKREALRVPPKPRRSEYGRHGVASGWSRCEGYLVSLGLRALNDRRSAGLLTPSRAVLVEAMRAEVDDRLGLFMIWIAREPGSASPDKYERWAGVADGDDLAEAAAEVLVTRWRPAWIDERRVEGRSGGQQSRRGATKDTTAAAWSLLHLRQAAEDRGERLTKARARAVLRVSEGTYNRLRRRLDTMLAAGVSEPESLWEGLNRDFSTPEVNLRSCAG